MSSVGNPLVLGSDEHGKPVRLSAADRSMHVYAVGATGTGKSSWLQALTRQDLLAWPDSRCGLLMLDPDGKLFDDVMHFAAAHDLRGWPILPLDLRRSDTAIAYNPLRKRPGTEAAVAVAAVTEAILHAFGQAESSETPRLAKWLTATLRILYSGDFTLLEALHLVSSPQLRKAMTANVEDVVAKAVWQSASHLKESEFQAEVESMMNRLRRFLATRVMRASLCQPDVSLDLRTTMDKGMIVLVSLATAGGQISDEDASTFGSLLLSDLWSAVTARGKRDGLRPFYAYLDEFQRFMTPAMAESLDRARGYGLHVVCAHQFPSQLSCRGESGQRVYRSVLANARTKVTFQLSLQEDLETMAQAICRQAIDPEQIKYQGSATRVVGHEVVYFPSYTTSVSDGTTTSRQDSEGGSIGVTTATSWTHTDSESFQVGVSDSETEGSNATFSDGESVSTTEGRAHSHQRALSSGESRSDTLSSARNHSESLGRTNGTSGATTVSYDLGRPQPALVAHATEHEKNAFDRRRPDYHVLAQDSVDPGDTLLRQATRRVSLTETRGGNQTESWNNTRGRTDTASTGWASQITSTDTSGVTTQRNQGQTRSHQEALGFSTASTLGVTLTEVSGSSDSYGGSESLSRQQNWSRASGLARSQSNTQGQSSSPHLVPLLANEKLPPQYRSIDEQTFLWMKVIDALPQRQCLVRLVNGLEPVRMTAPTVNQPPVRRRWIEAWTLRTLLKHSFALPMNDALARLARREQDFKDRFAPRPGEEPLTSRRKLG